ncbi:ribosomal protein S18-alanine N-acetyltransferase [Psychrosphaera ytuae]|uniref:[Ribosomal protein bS18]-alanine N-acetyltransferase n=1 Tax=Psychrosphaera ytuae TaxID=2820710 RepID=A0A975HJ16_9GAMM|nr:ribosomal protein S18-alanine N-acetyltransferase [Psychrosphaera ytuae]QTH64842.1 ribosomal protein S18-alanine N-acetyltransferase [Psychrosphaera ytuae]
MKTKLEELNHSHISELAAIEVSAHVTPWTEKIIRQSFGPRSHNVGLFEVDRGQYRLIGYYFSDHIAGEVSLENICISEAYQGRGLSKLLMANLIEHSKQIGATEIWLEVRSSNTPAIALYEAYGFSQEGVRSKYYTIPDSSLKEDALMMKLAL